MTKKRTNILKKIRGKNIGNIIIALLPFGIVALVLIYFAKPIFEQIKKYIEGFGDITDKLGIGTSKGEQQYTDISTNTETCWTPNFYKKAPSGAKLLTTAKQAELSKKIYDAWGFVAKDFDATILAIKTCSTQSQISILSEYFSKTYNKDLLTFIRPAKWTLSFRNYPTDDQFLIITNYVNNLPKYSN